MKRIGIVAGVQAELAALLPKQPRTALSGPPLPVDRVEHDGRALFLACAGIGKVAAATAAARLVLGHGAELLLVIGPAGIEAFHAADMPDLGLPAARIATSDLFVECGVHAAGVRDALGATLVDMETVAVAQAAALLGVPWAAIKATTDDADGGSAGDFTANLAASARAAARAAERLIAVL